jgi:hypothetical protein
MKAAVKDDQRETLRRISREIKLAMRKRRNAKFGN